jgi:hypothetical protein
LILSTKYDGRTEVWVATVQRKGAALTDISQYSREDLMELVENLDNVVIV